MELIQERSATALASAIESGELRATTVVEASIEAIEAKDPKIHAWVRWSADHARQQAREVDAGHRKGILAGIPIGVKDIIETTDFSTEFGSPIFRDYMPHQDAACVALVREAGGIVMGKTVTTEFAYFQPGPTTNPLDPTRTPGGSSSGSAAAVAAGMVPLAFGSQTAGSLIRPASYCGVWGFKPSYGIFSLAGVKPMAQTLDTLGWLARHIDDIALMRAVLLRDRLELQDECMMTPRIAVCRTFDWNEATEDTVHAMDQVAQALSRAGTQVFDMELPHCFARLTDAQRTIQAFEAARTFTFERMHHHGQLSDSVLKLIDQGLDCSMAEYERALRLAAECRQRLKDVFRTCDVILAPSAPGRAPLGLAATGDPVFNRMWTLLHVPCLNVPAIRDHDGMSVGVQLISNLFDDAYLLKIGKWSAKQLGI